MKVLSILLLVFLSGCSVVESVKKEKEKKERLQILGDSKKSTHHKLRTLYSQKTILDKDVAISIENENLKDVLQIILPGWSVKISNELAKIKIDAVIQSNAKDAVFDILRQVKAQVVFYDKIKPKPVAVIFAN
jgi:uncharacterized protein YceK